MRLKFLCRIIKMSSESKNLGYNSEDNFELPLENTKEYFEEKLNYEKLKELKEKLIQKLMKYSDYSSDNWKSPINTVKTMIENYEEEQQTIESLKNIDDLKFLSAVEKEIDEEEKEEECPLTECKAIIKSGKKKGKECGRVCCSTHKKQ